MDASLGETMERDLNQVSSGPLVTVTSMAPIDENAKETMQLDTNISVNNDNDVDRFISPTGEPIFNADRAILISGFDVLTPINSMIQEISSEEEDVVWNTWQKPSKSPKPKARNSQSNVTKISEQNSEQKSRMIILADSQGKLIGHLIEQNNPLKVCSFVKPGAKFDKVTEDVIQLTKDLNKNDYILVIAGTNNVEDTGINRLLDGVNKLINSTKHSNLIMATIPMRHDRPDLDQKISRINLEIEQIANNHNNLELLPIHMFPRHAFTSHGLHLNRDGKYKIVKFISELLQRSSRPLILPQTKLQPPQKAPEGKLKIEDGITVL